ncbi:MAG TPA: hypothetical protein VJQ46_13120 [Gemmatimonadales bacterium]|nr:hypothetical protein [Gemmatimonadales bacterium]
MTRAAPVRSILVLALLLWVQPAAAAPADTTALEFGGVRAGARLDALDRLVRSSTGGRLRCDRAKADRHVMECRAALSHPLLGGPLKLWVSAMDSVAGIITLSSDVTADQLDRWRASIERRYGKVDARVQGTQRMMQWVRHGRMLRLTWRIENGQRTASVSLVDGPVLDAWGQGRNRPRGS